MSDDLPSKIRQWLLGTGFPLEMQAAEAFQRVGFDVRQSSSYVDPQTEKGREIDVLATDPGLLGVLRVSFVIECKATTKPWVVLCSDATLSGYNRLLAFAVTSTAARSGLAESCTLASSITREFLFGPDRAGYAMREALTEKEQDVAYAAAISAVKACAGLIVEEAPAGYAPLCFSFPVIVVDSPLFECSRAPSGDLDITEVQRSSFLFSAHIPSPVGCLVHVVTRAHLPEFATWARRVKEALHADLGHHESNAL